MEKQTLELVYLAPVLVDNWITRVSKNATTGTMCVIMFHRYRHALRMGFFNAEPDIVSFIIKTARENRNQDESDT